MKVYTNILLRPEDAKSFEFKSQIILNEFKMQGHKMCSIEQFFVPFLYIIDYILSCIDSLEKLCAVYIQILCNS